MQRVQQTFQLSGISISLTENPAASALHTMSLVSNSSSAAFPGAIGTTDLGANGLSFIDPMAQAAQSVDQLEWIVAHNISHELMLAFGVGENYDQTGNYIDARNANFSMLIDPNATFSAARPRPSRRNCPNSGFEQVFQPGRPVDRSRRPPPSRRPWPCGACSPWRLSSPPGGTAGPLRIAVADSAATMTCSTPRPGRHLRDDRGAARLKSADDPLEWARRAAEGPRHRRAASSLLCTPEIHTVKSGLPTALLALAAFTGPLPAAEKSGALPKLATQVAFPNLRFDRPVAMAYPDDGSNRLFVVEQHQAKIWSFPNERDDQRQAAVPQAPRPDQPGQRGGPARAGLPSQVQGEPAVLRLLFGQRQRVEAFGRLAVPDVPRRRPAVADPASEQRIWVSAEDPFENHNGGTIAFGPDGYLYITLGDSGAADDPLSTGQNPRDWFGSILRIDVDHPVGRQALRHPRRQPGPRGRGSSPTGRPRSIASACGTSGSSASTARPASCGPATWARTSGRWSTGSRTAATTAGASRKAFHPFQPQRRQRPDPAAQIQPPIVEYPHAPTRDRPDSGLSITGGYVYRGKKIPELVGVYVYGDFDSGRIWGLRYENGKVDRQRRADRRHAEDPS